MEILDKNCVSTNLQSHIDAYCSPLPDGGVNIDAGAMVADLVIVAKMSKIGLADLQAKIAQAWTDVSVEIAPGLDIN